MQASGLPSGGRRLCFVFGEVFLCGMLAAADRLGTLDRGGVKCALLYFSAGMAPVCRGRPPPESDKGKGPGREKRARE